MTLGKDVGAAGPKPRLGMQSPAPFFALRRLKDIHLRCALRSEDG